MIFAATLVLGWLLGCVGAGGAGLTITLLTVGFGLPIHTAIAVSLSCMTFTGLLPGNARTIVVELGRRLDIA